eukprot:TRINITY_DN2860_c0_g1_i4.p1 TRINITY_DN2860_c0_g1~~TRINITY_DN2860_c0_g1_i4.p1  ORF type:complete len:224 (-),score=34.55 TRINITY_DN2860_c0_g1_i4:123-794(-)
MCVWCVQVKRLANRGVYDREAIYKILDEGFIAHVGFEMDGQPIVLPTGYGRKGDFLYLHAKASAHMIRALASGKPLCISVTLVDGLVMARAMFHHSMNYRSVVVFGQATEILEEEEKIESMRIFSDHVAPGRWNVCRLPNPAEIKATKMLKVEMRDGHVSAKVREGPPGDDDEDYAMDVWAGVLPLSLEVKAPIDDPKLTAGIPVPDHVAHYTRTPKESLQRP